MDNTKYRVRFVDDCITCINKNCPSECVLKNNCQEISQETISKADKYDLLVYGLKANFSDDKSLIGFINKLERE